MVLAILFFILGLIALIAGAKMLVFGASELALTYRFSPLFVGLTIVAFGTSAPEIAVNGLASLRGESGFVIGNVVGSNIFNVLLVLGVAATIRPLVVKRQLIRLDVPLMIGISLLVWFLLWAGELGRISGSFLVAGIFAYIFLIYKLGGREQEWQIKKRGSPLWLQIAAVLAGIVLLALGAKGLVSGAAFFVKLLGVSDLFIGLTLLAIGTSLPELAATLAALAKGEEDMAVGNVIGSNIFNLLAVLGISALVSPEALHVPPRAILFDFPVMLVVSLACLPIFLTGHLIARWEGMLFLVYYALYLGYLVARALGEPWALTLAFTLLFFIIPLTSVTLIVSLVRHIKSK